MKKKVLFAVVLALVFAFAMSVSAHASVLGDTQISFERAIQIAVEHTGNGTVTEIEWESKYGLPVYEIEIYRDRQKYEIKIDAVTGEIIRTKEKRTSSTPDGLTVSQVTSARTIELATTAINRAGGGRIVEINWDRERGRTVVEVEVNNNGQKHEFIFNAATDEIIRHRTRNR